MKDNGSLKEWADLILGPKSKGTICPYCERNGYICDGLSFECEKNRY